jgi:hypothetical protein
LACEERLTSSRLLKYKEPVIWAHIVVARLLLHLVAAT